MVNITLLYARGERPALRRRGCGWCAGNAAKGLREAHKQPAAHSTQHAFPRTRRPAAHRLLPFLSMPSYTVDCCLPFAVSSLQHFLSIRCYLSSIVYNK